MNRYFRRQLADYVEYHRDWWNGVMHVFGIILLFLGAVLPFSTWPISLFGIPTTAAAIAALPVLAYWLLLDVTLGAGILVAAALLLSAADILVAHLNAAGLWSFTVALIVIGIACQVVGHRVFERRQPALVDNPAHFLLGPMFVMAKLFVALGFKHDLAVILRAPSKPSGGPSVYPEQL
jgi:uncharacterized membrane protein YGL010W